MAPATAKHDTTDEKFSRLQDELKHIDSPEIRRRVKPSFPGPTDPAGGVLHRYPPLLWWPPLIPVVVALFAPTEVFDQWPALMHFCTWMIERFPILGGHGKFSSIPQVLTLAKCVSFALLFPLTIATFTTFWPRRHAYANARIRAGRISPPRFEELTLAIAAIFFFYGNWVSRQDPSWCRGCTRDSRLGLAIVEWASTFAVPALIVGLVVSLYVRSAVTSGRSIGEIATSQPRRM